MKSEEEAKKLIQKIYQQGTEKGEKIGEEGDGGKLDQIANAFLKDDLWASVKKQIVIETLEDVMDDLQNDMEREKIKEQINILKNGI